MTKIRSFLVVLAVVTCLGMLLSLSNYHESTSVAGNRSDEIVFKNTPPKGQAREVKESGGTDSNAKRSASVTDKTESALASNFTKAVDLRAFALEARKHPSEGGLSYSNAAVAYCRITRSFLKSWKYQNGERPVSGEVDSQTYGQRQMAAEKLFSRCMSFTDGELYAAEAVVDEKSLLSQKDSVQMAIGAVREAKQNKDQQSLVNSAKDAFGTRDPLVIENVLQAMMVQRERENDRVTVYIDGQRYIGEDAILVLDAATLVPCSFGADCSSNDLSVAMPCAGDFSCFKSREEMLLSPYEGSDPKRIEKIAQIKAKLTDIVKSGDASRLLKRG